MKPSLAGDAYRFQAAVRDLRESSALEIIDGLLTEGAEVDYVDPLVDRITLPSGRTMDSVAEPHGMDWDLALVHTVQPGHDHGRVEHCPRRDIV